MGEAKERRRRTLAATVACVWLVLLPVATAAAQAPDLVRVNGALRDLSAVDLEGREWSFQNLRGGVVLIDFWATWCAPCLAEIPYMQAALDRHPDRFMILGVSLDRASRREVVVWLNRQRVAWPQVHDGRGYGGGLALAFGIEQLPTSVLVDHLGRPRAFNARGDELLAAVGQLVAEMEAAQR